VTRLRTARVLHWALVASTALAALSLVDALGLSALHRPAGYAAIAVVLLRVVWGIARRRAVVSSGVVRMLCIAALASSGWLYTTDAYWGSEMVEDLHRALAWALLALVAWHVVIVIRVRMRHRKRGVQ
jgi:cytochrome b